jgi:hypothetical protein
MVGRKKIKRGGHRKKNGRTNDTMSRDNGFKEGKRFLMVMAFIVDHDHKKP